MITAREIVDMYVSFFEKRGHKRIENSPLVPLNDPTTLFTSSGMQALVPYLLGEQHPQGTRLVNVQNCFRAQDIEEIGDNRHTTFFRMLGNWSLGDPASPAGGQGGYFKQEQIPWMWEFVTKILSIPAQKLYVTVFEGLPAGRQGNNDVPKDEESAAIWKEIFTKEGLHPEERIFYYGAQKNWWSRSGVPENMPVGEPGGPDTEIFFEFDTPHDSQFGNTCHVNCDCGKYLEICNGVFMQYKKTDKGFAELPQKNVDFGGGLERLLAAVENKSDIFKTSLFGSIIQTIELQTNKDYQKNATSMRIVVDHFVASSFIIASHVSPSNKEQGYILRRLIRRGLDNFYALGGKDISSVLTTIAQQYKNTDPGLETNFESIKNTILEEEQGYKRTQVEAQKFVQKKYPSTSSGRVKVGDELKGVVEISADDAFTLYTTHGLSPSQIKSLGYNFDEQAFAEKMKAHQLLSRKGAEKKFRSGLADHSEKTIMGHTATHLLHQALRDVLGNQVHQTGSNITSERIRFDFNYDKKLTDEQIKKIEQIVNDKIRANLPVHFELIPTDEAKKMGAIGLFNDTYGEKSKIYFIGSSKRPYSVEFCGGPHVDFTGRLKGVKIIKQENLGQTQKRIYAQVGGLKD